MPRADYGVKIMVTGDDDELGEEDGISAFFEMQNDLTLNDMGGYELNELNYLNSVRAINMI